MRKRKPKVQVTGDPWVGYRLLGPLPEGYSTLLGVTFPRYRPAQDLANWLNTLFHNF